MRRLNVRYWHKADIALPLKNACFGGKADIAIDGPECPLMTQSGHRPPIDLSQQSRGRPLGRGPSTRLSQC